MLYKVLIDFGLVVLIWMTQLVVYPSFTYYSADDLVAWHSGYTIAIAIVVMPLMLGQLVVHGYDTIQGFSMLRVCAMALIVLVWVHTFFFAVPLHNQIGSGNDVIAAAEKLVHINWYRTVLWTLIFATSIYDYIKNESS